ncbi:MAG: hypothetical protein PF439_01970 [Helicobacteraceae bacterium]|jgi:uncharacterized membrane protein HdeD (DUF308 family)|nr:hypothetical protein [Helicobacteraceae bacterium]
MWIKVVKDGLSDDYERKSKWISALFFSVGTIILIYVLFSELATSSILGVTLTGIGLLSAYLTAKMSPSTPASWSKTLLIFFTGLFFLFVGMATLTSMGVLVGIFFLLGTLNNLYLAYLTRKDSTAYAWIMHALISGFFAIDILLHTSTLTANTIGLYIAINLMVDGLVVLYSGRNIFIRP